VASKSEPLLLPSVSSKAAIAALPKTAHPWPLGLPIAAKVNKSFTGAVASATLTATPAGDTRSATIWWGDGIKTTGTLTTTKTGLTVTGTHTYKKAGTYTVWIDVLQTTKAGKPGKVTTVLEHLKTTAVVTA